MSSLAELQSFERLLTMQIAGDDSPVLRKKLAAVRVQIEDAEAALTRRMIQEAIE